MLFHEPRAEAARQVFGPPENAVYLSKKPALPVVLEVATADVERLRESDLFRSSLGAEHLFHGLDFEDAIRKERAPMALLVTLGEFRRRSHDALRDVLAVHEGDG